MLVGPDPQQVFTVHYAIIAKRSVFVREYKRSTEDKRKPVSMPCIDPVIFDMYLHCLYSNEVPECIQSSTEDEATASLEQRADSRFKSLVNLYIVAHALDDPVTENMVVDEIKNFGQQDRTPGSEIIKLAISSIGSDSNLLNLLADLYIFNKHAAHKGDYPEAFLNLVMERFLRWKSIGGITIGAGLLANFTGSHKWASNEYYQKAEEEG